MTGRKSIIAIDGHSSCGKSTFAKAIASKLSYLYIDSGAMYRAVTLACMENGILSDDNPDDIALRQILEKIQIKFIKNNETSETETFLDGKNVERRIREIDVASNVSIVSKSVKVREKMVDLQRQMGVNRAIVMDGRDIGTVVFPGADLKIFMTAEADIRAQRRYKELLDRGSKVSLEEIKENILVRDQLDESRPESPLKKAPDAIVLDNSYMTPEQQMTWFENLWSELKL